jgi:FkbH-like protein
MIEPCDPASLLSLSYSELSARAQQVREARARATLPRRALSRKVALLSGSTTHFLSRLLDLFLFESGIDATIYEAPYGSLVENVLNPDSDLYRFAPDITILLPHTRDVGPLPEMLASASQVTRLVEQAARSWVELWQTLLGRTNTQIIQANFHLPRVRGLGNLEASVPFGPVAFVRALNAELVRQRVPSVHLLDLDYLTSTFGLERAVDLRNYYVSKQHFSFEFLPSLCLALARQVGVHAGLARKCVVLDLDGTVWGGTLADDGAERLVLGPDSAEGEAFCDFQRYLLQLKQRGVLLAVCSKNDPRDARAAFERHPHMLLKLEDIACFVANWEDKAANVLSIAQTLNIGLDAMVFVDNSAEERHRVRGALPAVHVLELPEDPADYARSLDAGAYFELAELTSEAAARALSFAEERQRMETQSTFLDYDAYLRSLQLCATLGPIDGGNLARACELIKRTNQFNLRTVRHSEAELRRLLSSSDNAGFQVSLADRFGSYGIIALVLLTRESDALFIDTWLMSCRVLNKGVERLVLARILREAKARGAGRVLGEYRPSAKNGMVRDLYPRLGFKQIAESDTRSLYELSLAGELPSLAHFIEGKEATPP